ncbi:hypothetical protein C7B76_11020 [filamentous cyanobacterium CCP2]|nr:hypothetical protein C7B76_11020 [filamentous cyanobacterium CCP2]
MSDAQSYEHYCTQACEYVVPLKIVVPIFLEPKVFVKASTCLREKVHVFLEPELHLAPEVKANQPICTPQIDCSKEVIAS